MQQKLSRYLLALLLCLSILMREVYPHSHCIRCRPTDYPRQYITTYYEVSDIKSNIRSRLTRYIGKSSFKCYAPGKILTSSVCFRLRWYS